jgi:hypothetical protein
VPLEYGAESQKLTDFLQFHEFDSGGSKMAVGMESLVQSSKKDVEMLEVVVVCFRVDQEAVKSDGDVQQASCYDLHELLEGGCSPIGLCWDKFGGFSSRGSWVAPESFLQLVLPMVLGEI